MGAFANMPLAVSTGLGVNAYFTYNVVGFCTPQTPYQASTTPIFSLNDLTDHPMISFSLKTDMALWGNADGTGSVKYQDALAAIFVEGWIFIILSVTGTRQFLIKLLPRTLALSMSAGNNTPSPFEISRICNTVDT